MRNALVIVIVCLSVSLLYDVYKEPISRLSVNVYTIICFLANHIQIHRNSINARATIKTGSRKRKNRHRSQTDSRKKVCRPLMMDA